MILKSYRGALKMFYNYFLCPIFMVVGVLFLCLTSVHAEEEEMVTWTYIIGGGYERNFSTGGSGGDDGCTSTCQVGGTGSCCDGKICCADGTCATSCAPSCVDDKGCSSSTPCCDGNKTCSSKGYCCAPVPSLSGCQVSVTSSTTGCATVSSKAGTTCGTNKKWVEQDGACVCACALTCSSGQEVTSACDKCCTKDGNTCSADSDCCTGSSCCKSADGSKKCGAGCSDACISDGAATVTGLACCNASSTVSNGHCCPRTQVYKDGSCQCDTGKVWNAGVQRCCPARDDADCRYETGSDGCPVATGCCSTTNFTECQTCSAGVVSNKEDGTSCSLTESIDGVCSSGSCVCNEGAACTSADGIAGTYQLQNGSCACVANDCTTNGADCTSDSSVCCSDTEQCSWDPSQSNKAVCCPTGINSCNGSCCPADAPYCSYDNTTSQYMCCSSPQGACNGSCCPSGENCSDYYDEANSAYAYACCSGELCSNGTCCPSGEQCQYTYDADGNENIFCCPAGVYACNGACCPTNAPYCSTDSLTGKSMCCASYNGACNGTCCPAETPICSQDRATGKSMCCASGPACNGICCTNGASCQTDGTVYECCPYSLVDGKCPPCDCGSYGTYNYITKRCEAAPSNRYCDDMATILKSRLCTSNADACCNFQITCEKGVLKTYTHTCCGDSSTKSIKFEDLEGYHTVHSYHRNSAEPVIGIGCKKYEYGSGYECKVGFINYCCESDAYSYARVGYCGWYDAGQFQLPTDVVCPYDYTYDSAKDICFKNCI